MSKILCILDGFGLSQKTFNNAVALAKMPHFRSLLKDRFWSTLNADGEHVGQEDGLVGNSEVGHMNIGGLKLVPQLSYQVTKSSENAFNLNKNIAPDQLFDPKELLKQQSELGVVSQTVHLIGLFSTGQIHSDLRHWAGAIEAAGQAGAEKIVMHIISDGRDSDRQSLVETWEYFVTEFEKRLAPFENKIFLGSLGGRFYAMDRDNNWERVHTGLVKMFNIWDLYQHDFNNQLSSSEMKYQNFLKDKYNITYSCFQQSTLEPEISNQTLKYTDGNLDGITKILSKIAVFNYSLNRFDETIYPEMMLYENDGRDKGNLFDIQGVSKNDTVWLLNFRTDRMKQFTQMLCDINKEFSLNLNILGMNDYGIGDKYQESYFAIFKNQPVQNTLAEFISSSKQTQLHIAETEKYNHVTFFLNGGQDKKSTGEDWVVIPSNKVNSHAEKPEMKAREVTDYILENGLNKYDYIIVNYANPDMIGHTGDINAAIKSMEALDIELGRLVRACELDGHQMIIIADHGNIEKVGEYEENGKNLIDTEHNANPVPFIIIDKNFDRNEFQNNLFNLSQKLELNLSSENIATMLQENNQLDLNIQENWLTKEQIPTPKFSLWLAGIAFLALK